MYRSEHIQDKDRSKYYGINVSAFFPQFHFSVMLGFGEFVDATEKFENEKMTEPPVGNIERSKLQPGTFTDDR